MANRRPPGRDAGTRAGVEKAPPGYDPAAFPPFAVTVDLVLLTVRDGRLETVLVHRDEPPYKQRWALPGGFVRPGEDLDAAVRRVFSAKTGIEVPYVEQLATYGAPDRDPRMRVVSVAYLVLLSPEVVTTDADASWSRFHPLDDLPAADAQGRHLAFDHDQILADAVDRAASKLEYTTLAATLLPDLFTIGDLRRVYEAVWGVELHPPNFTRKVRSITGFVTATPNRKPVTGAPQLYRRGPAKLMMPPLMRPPQSQ